MTELKTKGLVMDMINETIGNIDIKLETDKNVFSPSHVDKGTLHMLDIACIGNNEKVLDLGCGYGVVGIYCALISAANRVTMTDISEEAVNVANRNICLNGISGLCAVQGDAYENVPERDYTVILSNPPYHTDFSVAKKFIEGGFRHLATCGRMVMVTKRLLWYKNKMIHVFGGVRITERDGYYIFVSEKRPIRSMCK